MIAKEELVFHFELSPAELQWLSGAFGLMRLPLTNLPSGHSLQLSETTIREAQDSLQHRNLIHRTPGLGWQVDRLPAGILRWLGSAENLLTVDVHTRDGISRRADVFTEQDAGMVVTLDGDMYRFVLLPDGETLRTHLLDWLGASFSDPKTAPATYTFPQPVTILRAAWTDPALASKMLKITGLKPKEIKSILAWVASLEWVAALTRVQLEAEKATVESQTILCGNRQRAWRGSAGEKAENPVALYPINMEESRAIIQNLL